ncbi:hypothetical protein [Paracoccus siganidrum]|uniref:HK97 gp10 family phage protein n=1 Tax=Paracoccus siganidrum TaxID=1276757 RepID=A0A419A3X2_9RHOB|nr:hypothetical protein [Paracoccus siganidrum]RJL08415.1 hypothetical protein D3P05_16225 [Paracoccus siganidrum]RMC39325.1 hypothetical protein C9E82_04935 [Paracoccus siganidrum]
MARIIGDRALNARLTRMARGADVTPALVRAAERTRAEYIEKVQQVSPGRTETRYSPRREVTVSAPGSAPNTDTGDLVNNTGAGSFRRNQAEAWSSMGYADDLEFGTHKMAPRPAMQPAFDETKQQALNDIAAALRKDMRNG